MCKINVSVYLEGDYVKIGGFRARKNKAKQSQFTRIEFS